MMSLPGCIKNSFEASGVPFLERGQANLRPDNTSVKAIVAHFMFSDSGPDEVWAAGKFEEDCDADDVHTRGS